jgi:small subunit ribosomal protein S6
MREYELTAIYNLTVAETGGPEASVQALTSVVEARGGEVLKVDHWGRRRMAYPIGDVIDGDYIIMRANLEPTAITPLESALRIDERVFRHIVVRADELPVPLPPREPRRAPGEPAPGDAAQAGVPAGTAPAAAAASEAAPAAATPEVAPAAEAPAETAPVEAAPAEAPVAPAAPAGDAAPA